MTQAKIENRQGTYYRLRGDYEQAQKHLEKAVSLWPGFAAAHNDLAGVYFIRGAYDKAEKHYRQAIQLSGRDATPHFGLARVHIQRREHDQAERELTTVIKYDPEDIEALVLLGRVYVRQFLESRKLTQKERAIWCWQQAVKAGDPSSAYVAQARQSLRKYQ